MRLLLSAAIAAFATLCSNAQYGTFNADAVTGAKAGSTLVLLDDGDSPFNRTIMDAMRAHWKFTAAFDFIRTGDLATQPLDASKTYLMKIQRSDAEKHNAVFLALVQGWKQKKGEALTVSNGAVMNLPAEQELASIMIDAKAVANAASPMLHAYVKHLQDYLKEVENGRIKDKTTADRLYADRNRLVKEMKLWIAAEHLDKSMPDAAKVQETYTRELEVLDLARTSQAVVEGQADVAVTDVVITGDNKTKWCFKRVFNANTGELMYLRDDAALYGKKEGFITEDFRMLEQSR